MMKLLIVCTHNRCRSILAEAIAAKLLAPDVQVRSAGSAAEGKVHPLSLQYLAQRGYETKDLHSESWDALGDWQPDIIITVCDSAANEACPLILGPAEKVHWGLVDPSKTTSDTAQCEANFMATIDLLEDRFAQAKAAFTVDITAEQLANSLRKLHH
ncbi:arsenate reductase ArsC [Umboniibacter marinipuniceus]|nr:arsenate reductase ArsC [Umboniibacter marinipuniceus]